VLSRGTFDQPPTTSRRAGGISVRRLALYWLAGLAFLLLVGLLAPLLHFTVSRTGLAWSLVAYTIIGLVTVVRQWISQQRQR
jgi:hypothetical protein